MPVLTNWRACYRLSVHEDGSWSAIPQAQAPPSPHWATCVFVIRPETLYIGHEVAYFIWLDARGLTTLALQAREGDTPIPMLAVTLEALLAAQESLAVQAGKVNKRLEFVNWLVDLAKGGRIR